MYFDFNLPYTKNDAKNPNRLRLILARYSECEWIYLSLSQRATLLLTLLISGRKRGGSQLYNRSMCSRTGSYPTRLCNVLPLTLHWPLADVDDRTDQYDRYKASRCSAHATHARNWRACIQGNQSHHPIYSHSYTHHSQEALAALRSKYQLIAIRTCNPRVFEEACSTYDIDIISLDSSKRLSFRLDPLLVKQAIARGVYFELCYSHGIQGKEGGKGSCGLHWWYSWHIDHVMQMTQNAPMCYKRARNLFALPMAITSLSQAKLQLFHTSNPLLILYTCKWANRL